MKINVGEFDVLEAGVILSSDNLPIKFTLEHNNEIIEITIIFSKSDQKNEDGTPIHSSRTEVLSGSKMNIYLGGWDTVLSVATPHPLHLGSIGGRELKLLIRSYGINDSTSRMLAHTWLLGATV